MVFGTAGGMEAETGVAWMLPSRDGSIAVVSVHNSLLRKQGRVVRELPADSMVVGRTAWVGGCLGVLEQEWTGCPVRIVVGLDMMREERLEGLWAYGSISRGRYSAWHVLCVFVDILGVE